MFRQHLPVKRPPHGVQNLLVKYKDLYHITLGQGQPRIAHASIRFPRPLISKLKAELDKMAETEVITPLKEPTLVLW